MADYFACHTIQIFFLISTIAYLYTNTRLNGIVNIFFIFQISQPDTEKFRFFNSYSLYTDSFQNHELYFQH